MDSCDREGEVSGVDSYDDGDSEGLSAGGWYDS